MLQQHSAPGHHGLVLHLGLRIGPERRRRVPRPPLRLSSEDRSSLNIVIYNSNNIYNIIYNIRIIIYLIKY